MKGRTMNFKCKMEGVVKGNTYVMVHRHDDYCPVLNGGDICTCNVEVELMEAKDWLRMIQDQNY